MTDCQRCGAKSSVYLCNPHTDELRDMCNELPRLTHHLAEAATGQTRLGEPARRTRSDDQPMRINLRASQLLEQINNTLVRWVQQCQTRGATYRAPRICPPNLYDGTPLYGDEIVSPYSSDTAKLAYWLARNTTTIAAADDAGACFDEIHAAVHRTLTVINRPIPPKFCGPCPAAHPDDPTRRCNHQLTARGGAIEVTCPQCATTHNTDDLWQRMLTEVGPMRFTVEEIHTMMSRFGEPLNQRTFQHWRKIGKVKPSGYRRHDGKTVPMYRLSDVINVKYRVGAGS